MAERESGTRTYKTVAMPSAIRGGRRLGRSRGDRVAQAMADLINKEAAQGWSYVGSDTIRSQERAGLFGGMKENVYTVLVFERFQRGRVEPGVPQEEPARRRRTQPDALEEAARTVRRVGAGASGGQRRGYGFDEELTADRSEETERRPMRRREARVAARRNGEDEFGATNGRGARGLVETMRQHRDRN